MIYKQFPIKTEGSLEYAKLTVYVLDTPGNSIQLKVEKRPMILLCPGGGYAFTSFREAEPLAMSFLSKGYHACVLDYSVSPARFPTQLQEVEQAMKIICDHSEEWKVDTENIYIHGASAGGHLACSYGAFWNKEYVKYHIKPAGIILSYPVITSNPEYAHMDSFYNLLGDTYENMKGIVSLENQITDTMPPTFVWHTDTDALVPVENSLLLAMALKRAGVSMELHIFPEGEHGLSLANYLVETTDGSGVNEYCACWIEYAHKWLSNQTKKEK